MPGHPAVSTPRPLDIVRNGAFARLWLTGALLGTVRWLEILGVGVWTFAETGSPLAVAVMLFLRTAPMPLLGVPMGALADRLDRRWLLAGGLAAGAATSFSLLALAAAGALSPWQVGAGAFVSGTVWTMEHPVRRALLADVVGIERVGIAISLDAATFNATRMTGPLAGGALYATIGLAGIYGFALLAQVLAIVLVLRRDARSGRVRRGAREPFRRSLVEGLAAVRASPVLAGVMVTTVFANLFGFAYPSTVPVIGDRVLGLDAFTLGVLASMEGLGALCGALALAFLVSPASYGRIFLGGAALFLAMLVVFSQTGSLAVAMAALFLAGIGIASFGAMQSAIIITAAAPEIRSRVMGVLVVAIGAGPLGALLLGSLGAALGASQALAITAGAGLAGVALSAVRWPTLWRGSIVRSDGES